ncbi:MAG TPA: hypothetical protein DCS43_05510 [Verrucomicrobia bacterium]|nr:hypothetical protein [Verrucomicrobiota bacterium]
MRFEQGVEWGWNEPREAFLDAGERMADGGPESEEREYQKLISIVTVGESESVSRNQLMKCELIKMKNGEMSPAPDFSRPIRGSLIS